MREPMDKNPYVYVNAGFVYKNSPKDYHGLIQDNWSFGKDGKASMSVNGYNFIIELADFYEITGTLSRQQTLTELRSICEKISNLVKKAEKKLENDT